MASVTGASLDKKFALAKRCSHGSAIYTFFNFDIITFLWVEIKIHWLICLISYIN
jgi:hypothetical protein